MYSWKCTGFLEKASAAPNFQGPEIRLHDKTRSGKPKRFRLLEWTKPVLMTGRKKNCFQPHLSLEHYIPNYNLLWFAGDAYDFMALSRSLRELARTLCCENIALGTSPHSLTQGRRCQGKWSDFIPCHLAEGQVGSWSLLWGFTGCRAGPGLSWVWFS